MWHMILLAAIEFDVHTVIKLSRYRIVKKLLTLATFDSTFLSTFLHFLSFCLLVNVLETGGSLHTW
jgi:hypothetical protein